LPKPFLEITEILRSPNTSIRAVADIIAKDIAMTAELLKLTNSAFFSVGARITTPLQATRTLGLETIQALVLRIGIFRQFSGNDPAVTSMMATLTDHSLAIAKLTESIAEAEGCDQTMAKTAYCAGMFCHLGMLILLDANPGKYRDVLSKACEQTPLESIETETFGASNALLGGYLLGLWGFSQAVVEAVSFSARPAEIGIPENLLLTALHAARAFGPPLPWLSHGNRDVRELDRGYIEQCRRSERIALWQDIATHSIDKVK
jgi:HD-like signal output (HDOD) protein